MGMTAKKHRKLKRIPVGNSARTKFFRLPNDALHQARGAAVASDFVRFVPFCGQLLGDGA